MLDIAARRKACEDTISRSPAIAAQTPGGSLSSAFIPSQLPPLSKSSANFPNLPRNPVQILDSDSFAAASTLISVGGNARKVAVLNLASDEVPGGGWRVSLALTQEEALCYSSTLYATLKPEWYPWPNLGPGSCAGIYSPSVVVFKDTLDHDLAELPLERRFTVAVITVAAPRLPQLTRDKLAFANATDMEDLREKIKLILRMAACNGNTDLVLGAMGCGAYRCPPAVVAREMRAALESEEFLGWFENVVFAVYGSGRVGKQNLEVFRQVFGCST